MTIGTITHRFRAKGYDELGRWCWIRLSGRKGKTIRVISIYKPTRNLGKGLSTYSQQRRMLQARDDDRCPTKAFWEDLWAELDNWIGTGDHIILGGDFNEDTQEPDLLTQFGDRGLVNPLAQRYPSLKLPPTRKGGTKTIDNIFVSEELRPTRAGFLEIGEGIPSDHRAIWMDFTTCSLFGNSSQPTRTNPRRLSLGNPRSVSAYLSTLKQYMRYHKVKEKLIRLESDTTINPDERNKALNTLDRVRTAGVKYAEKNCRKLSMGHQPWTPMRSRLRDEIEYWSLLIKQKKGKKCNVKKICRLGKKLHKARSDSLDLETMELSKQRAVKKWREYTKTNHDSIRASWLESKASYIESQGGGDRAKILTNLIHRERQRLTTRRLNNIFKDESTAGVSTVCKVESGIRQQMTTKEDIENACLTENLKRFTQAHNTTFSKPQVTDIVGNLGISPECSNILAGQSEELPLSSDQKKFISCLQIPTKVIESGPIPCRISNASWKSCWKAQREYTSAGPSGLHFGNFKANAMDEDLCYIDSTLTSIPFETGFPLERWKHGINVMLYKKSLDNNVEKLRTILLYEADFNAANKILGRSMLKNGEKCGSIAKEQYGSRKNKSAILQCANKRLTFDLWRQSKSPGAILSNDAKSCYDRILHNIASLCMQRQGVSRNNVICMFSTIQQLRHTVRTAFGDSTTSFGRELWLAPLHGVGQGNGAGPAIWAVVSSPILDLLRRESQGFVFRCSLSGSIIKIIGYSFVDDTDLVVGGSEISQWEIADELQNALDTWHMGIELTGGALVPAKSFWSEVQFEWDRNGNWSYSSTKSNGKDVYMQGPDLENHVLTKVDANEAIETLGVRLATDGSEDAQAQAMRSKAERWASKMKKRGVLNQSDAWIGLTTTILKTLQYPLPVTCLSETQCTSILAPVLNTALPAIGISRRFRREFIQGPAECMGLGLPSLYTFQGAAHIDLLVTHWRETNDTGNLLRASLESLKLEIGSNEMPFD